MNQKQWNLPLKTWILIILNNTTDQIIVEADDTTQDFILNSDSNVQVFLSNTSDLNILNCTLTGQNDIFILSNCICPTCD